MGWMVTFGDIMTLLLTFFVLLLSFSSFEEVKFQQFAGSFRTRSYTSIFPAKLTSPVAPPPEQLDTTKEGSEKRTDEKPKSIKNPRTPLDQPKEEAEKYRKFVSIPSGRLFLGKGSTLKADGKAMLDTIAAFLRKSPCHVMIGESRLGGAVGGGPRARTVSAERAKALVKYFTKQGKPRVPADLFSISAENSDAARSHGGRPTVRITLLAKGLY